MKKGGSILKEIYMEASARMSMRRPRKVDIWRRFLDEPTWWAMREELD